MENNIAHERQQGLKDVSILIPTYNERDNILIVIDSIADILKEYRFEIIVIDDQSLDGTGKLAADYAIHRPWLRVMHRKAVRSLSSSVMDGLRLSQGRILCVLDADMSHDLTLLPQMIELVKQGVEVVVGSRRIQGAGVVDWPYYRHALSLSGNWLARVLLHVPVADAMSGYFAMDRYFYERVHKYVDPKGYKILLEFCVRGHPNAIQELPYVFRDREKGISKFTFFVGFEYLKMLAVLTTYTWINFIRRRYHLGRYRRVLPLIPDGRLLEIGCGQPCESMPDGQFLDYYKKGGIGVDLKLCYINSPFVQASADSLPFSDNTFDTVVAMELLEHLTEPQLEKTLQEISRILRPTGCAIVTTPNNSLLWRILWFFCRHTIGKKIWKHAHKINYTRSYWLKVFQRYFFLDRLEGYLGLLLVAKLRPIESTNKKEERKL